MFNKRMRTKTSIAQKTSFQNVNGIKAERAPANDSQDPMALPLFLLTLPKSAFQPRLKWVENRCGLTVRPASHHGSIWNHYAFQFRWGDACWNTYHGVVRNSETRHQTSSLGLHSITAWCNCWLSWEVSRDSAAPEEEQKSNFMTEKKSGVPYYYLFSPTIIVVP